MTAPSSSSDPAAAVTTTTTNRSSRNRRSRSRSRSSAPSPNSLLDRRALVAALERQGLMYNNNNNSGKNGVVRPQHIDTFYQALHRQQYPAQMADFVATYHANERAAAVPQKNNISNNNSAIRNSTTSEDQAPLQNNIPSSGGSNNNKKKKNRNKGQLPKPFLDFLLTCSDQFVVSTSVVAHQQTSADGSTTKLAVRLHDGQMVESVLMRYDNKANSSKSSHRASLCVSSQCGCAMGCTFCATGTMGLSGNLSTGEILEQVVHADRILARESLLAKQQKSSNNNNKENQRYNNNKVKKPNIDSVRNVVFMGMGEPLDNYKNVVEACRALIDNKRWNLAHSRVTVSTVGIIDKIRKLTAELPEVSLALSLHAPNQAMRSAIVPTAKNFPIEQLVDALDGHMMAYLKKRNRRHKNDKRNVAIVNEESGERQQEFSVEERIKESTRRRAMIEYVMLEGDTSTLEAAHQLGKLCEGRHLVVNLIPYNQTDVKDKLRCPSAEHMQEFRNIVASYGSFCTIRRTMGADIDSACGQLITDGDGGCGDGGGVRDIEDVAATTHSTLQSSSRIISKKVNKSSNSSLMEAADVDKTTTAGTSVAMEQWIGPLAAATSLAASCFVVSATLFLRQKRR